MLEHHPISALLTSAIGPIRQQSWRELAHTKVIPKKKVNSVQYKTVPFLEVAGEGQDGAVPVLTQL